MADHCLVLIELVTYLIFSPFVKKSPRLICTGEVFLSVTSVVKREESKIGDWERNTDE